MANKSFKKKEKQNAVKGNVLRSVLLELLFLKSGSVFILGEDSTRTISFNLKVLVVQVVMEHLSNIWQLIWRRL